MGYIDPEKRRAWFRRRYERWVKLGLCEQCGKGKPKKRLRCCQACLRLHHNRYEARKRSGLCAGCGRVPPAEGKLVCASCASYYSAQGRKRRRLLKRQNKCLTCGRRKPYKTLTKCKSCSDTALKSSRVLYREKYKGNTKWHRAKTLRIKKAAFDGYGGSICKCCGETIIEFLSIDHINEDGAAHRRRLFGGSRGAAGSAFYGWLKRNGFPPGFQVLCHNCNRGKHFNGGVCPHQDRNNPGYRRKARRRR